MNIKNQLLVAHSKSNNLLIYNWIGTNAERFAELMEAFLGSNPKIVQRAAWSISKVGIKHPHLVSPYIDQMITAVEQPLHPAVQRNVFKLLADVIIPLTEGQEGKLLILAFDLLADPSVTVAIRVHAMQFIANLCKAYPDLAIELKTLIEDGLENGSAGFRSRGKRILKKIK